MCQTLMSFLCACACVYACVCVCVCACVWHVCVCVWNSRLSIMSGIQQCSMLFIEWIYKTRSLIDYVWIIVTRSKRRLSVLLSILQILIWSLKRSYTAGHCVTYTLLRQREVVRLRSRGQRVTELRFQPRQRLPEPTPYFPRWRPRHNPHPAGLL
jgi:IS1 family transposase